MATTKKDVEAAFKRLIKLSGGEVAERVHGKTNIGKYFLDYNPSYGGYQVARVVTEGGGIDTPFGSRRMKAGEAEAAFHLASNVLYNMEYEKQQKKAKRAKKK